MTLATRCHVTTVCVRFKIHSYACIEIFMRDTKIFMCLGFTYIYSIHIFAHIYKHV